MTIKTLECIHRLLKQNEADARAARNEYSDKLKETAGNMWATDENLETLIKLQRDAFDALEDFENHEF